jgi:hypothetical protein
MTFFCSSRDIRSLSILSVDALLNDSFRILVISLFMDVLLDLARRLIFLCSVGGNRSTNFTWSVSGIPTPLEVERVLAPIIALVLVRIRLH